MMARASRDTRSNGKGKGTNRGSEQGVSLGGSIKDSGEGLRD